MTEQAATEDLDSVLEHCEQSIVKSATKDCTQRAMNSISR